LFDTLAVEDMMALRFDSILGDIVAKTAERRFTLVLNEELALIISAPQNEIGVTRHLPHSGKETEDIRIVYSGKR
jgi:hypothetical protein